MITRITSRQNPTIRYAIKLKNAKTRASEGKAIIEGFRIIDDLIGLKPAYVEELLVDESMQDSPRYDDLMKRSLDLGIKVSIITPELSAHIASTENPQGIFAVVSLPYEDQSIFNDTVQPFILVLDQVRDPGNLGTIIRAGAAAGITGIVIGKGSVDPFNDKVIRSAMGGIFRVPILRPSDLEGMLIGLKSRGIRVLIADPEGGTPCYEWDLRSPVAIALGNEAEGCSVEVKRLADGFITIPMPGNMESLNVGMAAAILIYEGLRQRLYPDK